MGVFLLPLRQNILAPTLSISSDLVYPLDEMKPFSRRSTSMFSRSENSNANLYLTRIALVMSVVLAWLAQNSYLPTPLEIVKNISIPFPCQYSGCGCKDAVQCWSSCGCHTDAEKIAWAKQNSVQPPEWFLEDVEIKLAEQEPKSSGGCCCCSKKTDQPPIEASSNGDAATRVVYLNLKQRRKCQGQYDVDLGTWYFVSPADRPLPPVSISPVALAEDASPLEVTLRPPTPPPKHV